MSCPACGHQNSNDARFCARCGRQVALVTQQMTALAYVCPHCDERSHPEPYFSRGVNVAKMVALLIPLSVVGPLVFFFLRKDRAICASCRRLLPGEQPRALLNAFSRDRLLLAAHDGANAALPAMASAALAEGDAVSLERKSRRNQARAIFMAVGSCGFLALAGTVSTWNDAGPLLVFSGLFGTGTVITALRSSKLGQLARTRRQKRRHIQILDLARGNKGTLTVTLVASHLGVDLPEAEALLDGMLDGSRVDVQADDHGRVVYIFPELRD